MATLQNIRNRAGVLVAVVIGLALLAFILSDLFSSGNPLFVRNQFEIAKIEGKSIHLKVFQDKLRKMVDAEKIRTNKSSLSAEEQEMVQEQVWNQLLQEYILKDEFKAIGLDVTVEEVWEMVQGNNPHPYIRSMFSDPETQQFNKYALMQFLKEREQDEKKAILWLYIEEQIINERRITKFNNLIRKGLYVTNLQSEIEKTNTEHQVDFNYIVKKYNSIPDSLITVTQNQIEKYYKEHKEDYKQTASRDIQYISFDIKPSDEDYAHAEVWIDSTTKDFNRTKANEQFIRLNSDEPFDNKHYKKDEVSELIRDFVLNADTGEVYGPYFENSSYKLSKVIEIVSLPDSINARHIILRPQETSEEAYKNTLYLADSLVDLIKNGSSFEELALQYSADRSRDKGGEIGWFAEGDLPFYDSCFYLNNGDIKKLETRYGIHIVQVTDKTEKYEKVKIATLVRLVEPSTVTYQETYNKASKFSIVNNTKEKFEAAVIKNNYIARTADNLLESTTKIVGLEAPRDLIRWAFSANEGDVSPVLEIEDKFVVATLTSVRKEGYAPLEKIKAEIEAELLKDHKADKIVSEINEYLPNILTINQLADALQTKLNEATGISFNSYSLPNIGIEPKLTAIASNLDEGILSDPIIGNNGVYVISVSKINNIADTEPYNYNAAKYRMERMLQSRVNYECYNALKEAAKIEDNRIKFY